jgi:hypothetical protein
MAVVSIHNTSDGTTAVDCDTGVASMADEWLLVTISMKYAFLLSADIIVVARVPVVGAVGIVLFHGVGETEQDGLNNNADDDDDENDDDNDGVGIANNDFPPEIVLLAAREIQLVLRCEYITHQLVARNSHAGIWHLAQSSSVCYKSFWHVNGFLFM